MNWGWLLEMLEWTVPKRQILIIWIWPFLSLLVLCLCKELWNLTLLLEVISKLRPENQVWLFIWKGNRKKEPGFSLVLTYSLIQELEGVSWRLVFLEQKFLRWSKQMKMCLRQDAESEGPVSISIQSRTSRGPCGKDIQAMWKLMTW